MQLAFTKMNGAGNDFVLIDNREKKVCLSAIQVAKLCHRQRGVGADGVILWKDCNHNEAKWAWQFFNSDGSEADMCGNGARCFARFVANETANENEVSFLTGCGVIRAHLGENGVTVNLTDPEDLRLNECIDLSTGLCEVHSVNTGVPHAVLFVKNADAAMVDDLGEEIRRHSHYAPHGTNVNFVQMLAPGHIRVRTYERGVGETLACGTGVSASALIASKIHDFKPPVKVEVLGGDVLSVNFNSELRDAELTGPAEFVYEGIIEI